VDYLPLEILLWLGYPINAIIRIAVGRHRANRTLNLFFPIQASRLLDIFRGQSSLYIGENAP